MNSRPVGGGTVILEEAGPRRATAHLCTRRTPIGHRSPGRESSRAPLRCPSVLPGRNLLERGGHPAGDRGHRAAGAEPGTAARRPPPVRRRPERADRGDPRRPCRIDVSAGWVMTACTRMAAAVAPTDQALRDAIADANVGHFDEPATGSPPETTACAPRRIALHASASLPAPERRRSCLPGLARSWFRGRTGLGSRISPSASPRRG
jgi:hypothetical protein